MRMGSQKCPVCGKKKIAIVLLAVLHYWKQVSVKILSMSWFTENKTNTVSYIKEVAGTCNIYIDYTDDEHLFTIRLL